MVVSGKLLNLTRGCHGLISQVCTVDVSAQVEADEAALREDVRVVFSGEEGGGRYLDLHAHFHRFVNAKFGRQLDYTAFVADLPCTEGVPRQLRLGQPYRRVPGVVQG